ERRGKLGDGVAGLERQTVVQRDEALLQVRLQVGRVQSRGNQRIRRLDRLLAGREQLLLKVASLGLCVLVNGGELLGQCRVLGRVRRCPVTRRIGNRLRFGGGGGLRQLRLDVWRQRPRLEVLHQRLARLKG